MSFMAHQNDNNIPYLRTQTEIDGGYTLARVKGGSSAFVTVCNGMYGGACIHYLISPQA